MYIGILAQGFSSDLNGAVLVLPEGKAINLGTEGTLVICSGEFPYCQGKGKQAGGGAAAENAGFTEPVTIHIAVDGIDDG